MQVHGPLELEQGTRVAARWCGQEVTLTAKEFDVLEALLLRRPRVVSRQQLEDVLYGWGDEIESNAIEVYVHFLRRKFTPGLIMTVRGKGYQMGNEDVLNAEVARQGPPGVVKTLVAAAFADRDRIRRQPAGLGGGCADPGRGPSGIPKTCTTSRCARRPSC